MAASNDLLTKLWFSQVLLVTDKNERGYILNLGKIAQDFTLASTCIHLISVNSALLPNIKMGDAELLSFSGDLSSPSQPVTRWQVRDAEAKSLPYLPGVSSLPLRWPVERSVRWC